MPILGVALGLLLAALTIGAVSVTLSLKTYSRTKPRRSNAAWALVRLTPAE